MNNVRRRSRRWTRAITKLGARRRADLHQRDGRALDEPEFSQCSSAATTSTTCRSGCTPARPATRADYVGEQKSKYEIWQVLGWPFETSIAMARMVFLGLLREAPRPSHHHASLRRMIPYFSDAPRPCGRSSAAAPPTRTTRTCSNACRKTDRVFPHVLRATRCSALCLGLRCGLDFFGADRVVFASDCPFDPEGGPMVHPRGIRSVEDLKLSEADKRKIYFGNAMKLLSMPDASKNKGPRGPFYFDRGT